MRITIVVFAVSVANVGNVHAQEHKFYVETEVISSQQQAPSVSGLHFDQGLGGSATGIATVFGVHFSRFYGLSVEGVFPARYQTIETFFYPGETSIRFDNNHRDNTVSGLLTLHPLSHRIRPELLAGMTLVQEDTVQRVATAPVSNIPGVGFVYGDFGPYGSERATTRQTYAATVGGNVAVMLGPRISLVTSLRFHWVNRDEPLKSGSIILAPFFFRAGIGARAVF